MQNKNENVKFKCWKCGSSRLAYHKFVKCLTPVLLNENGHIEYGESIIDEDDYMAVANGFCCGSCKHLIDNCGRHIETEKELLDYLSLAPYIREQKQKEYDKQLADQIQALDDQEMERACS